MLDVCPIIYINGSLRPVENSNFSRVIRQSGITSGYALTQELFAP